MSLSDVSNILWRERQLLELLLYKLEVEHCLLTRGGSRWVAHANREMEAVIDELEHVELARAVEVQRACAQLGIDDVATLRQLAETAPSPWGAILEEHRGALLVTTDEIAGFAECNLGLLSRGCESMREALVGLGRVGSDTSSPHGSTTPRAGSTLVLDELP